MKLIYKNWENFCSKLAEANKISVSAKDVLMGENNDGYVVLKHDVETAVKKAYKIALIEKKYGHCGSYYIQADLLDDERNVFLFNEMKNMGHEISYHYDVMDSNQGNLKAAIKEFDDNKQKFESIGYEIITVCQHGNPIVERKGYTSNRDFFRSKEVQTKYNKVSDIMVDFPEKAKTSYSYYSDAGRKFQKIYDPFGNDIINSDDKNIGFADLNELFDVISCNGNHIISMHPHRWTSNVWIYSMKHCLFMIIKSTARILVNIPFMKKLMSRYFYLAKKI